MGRGIGRPDRTAPIADLADTRHRPRLREDLCSRVLVSCKDARNDRRLFVGVERQRGVDETKSTRTCAVVVHGVSAREEPPESQRGGEKGPGDPEGGYDGSVGHGRG